MANNKSKKKAQQKTPASNASAAKAAPKKAEVTKAASKKPAKKNAKPGVFSQIKGYFTSVRSEMKRVVWPTKKELVNYSVAVCVSLVVVGVAIALLDLVISQGLVLFSGLRG